MTTLIAYRPYWHPIARSSDVTDKPRQFTLLGERLVAFRTPTGLSVFKDLCIHRGAALSMGRVVNGNIECPYHGWQYDPSGACVRIPSLRPNQPIPSKAKAIAYQVREMADLVWVSLEEPIAPFPDFPEEWAYGREDLRSCFIGEYDWPVDAGRAVENFLDVSHFPFVHDGTLGSREHTEVTQYEVEHDQYSLRFSYDQVEPGDPSTGQSETMKLIYYFRAPFTVHLKRQTEHQDWSVVTLFVSPVDQKTSRLFLTFVRNYDMDPSRDTLYTDFQALVMNEDKAVVSSVRPEEIPLDLREELHIKLTDTAGLLFRRILNRIEAEGRAVA
jgi:phenylpropionate dioxygenase-like ring-hydroxylating dioxygenase large terminal subunit